MISYAAQEPLLFQATILANMLHANPFATIEGIYHALERSQCLT